MSVNHDVLNYTGGKPNLTQIHIEIHRFEFFCLKTPHCVRFEKFWYIRLCPVLL
ncbi:hypothetical protein GmarT_02920 [Gimesia maris]|jgi:hypothetical protein|uniref:Uncharacterized protein n=1 Tax=Gimesia maris TaxID=122 RepID=A0ABX5YFG3_9PLAN|nr:hypothetical protein Mal35_03020 [Gimesia maris]QDU12518.1 hypothetical protein CA11_02970 [Gimesia maris]QEG14457.1 hypothetical protein GmarT_02920 [Gimesia maris]